MVGCVPRFEERRAPLLAQKVALVRRRQLGVFPLLRRLQIAGDLRFEVFVAQSAVQAAPSGGGFRSEE